MNISQWELWLKNLQFLIDPDGNLLSVGHQTNIWAFAGSMFKTKIVTWSPRIDLKIFFFMKPGMILLAQGQIYLAQPKF